MEIIKSKVEENKILHVIKRLSEIENQTGRSDILEEQNFLQCSSLKLEKGKTFRPHKHITKKRTYDNQIAQESWVIIKGSVKCIFYDIDDTIIGEYVLHAGDASFTLYGGHTYEILEDNTLIYEYKTGPYEGQAMDKIFID
jgi:cupin fold WbuC family metalloprotein